MNRDYNCMQAVHLYPEHTYQTWKGFGGAFTEAAGYTWSKLTSVSQKEFTDAYFSPDGIGYTFCRMHINSCDFALDNYAYLEEAPDKEWSKFDTARDGKYILPLVHAAMQTNQDEMTFLASPWSPPAFMKTNGEMEPWRQPESRVCAHLGAVHCQIRKGMCKRRVFQRRNSSSQKVVWNTVVSQIPMRCARRRCMHMISLVI